MGSTSLIICLLLFSFHSYTFASTPEGSINRVFRQQILATIEPNSDRSSEPVMRSSTGKYAANFLRTPTSPGAGGFGTDFCFLKVEDTSDGQSMWESECTPVSSANACSLVFTDEGLEIYDGSRSAWDNGVGADEHLRVLELVDAGDMRIRDQSGELVWRASDEPRANQRCGLPGSPGLASALPPFASPFNDGGTNLPFGKPQLPKTPFQGQPPLESNEHQPSLGSENGFGQPLVDNTPFDSGSGVVGVGPLEITLAVLALVITLN